MTFLLLSCSACLSSQGKPPLPDITLTQQDRVLILAPHPDDETLTCGGIIQKAMSMQLPVHVAFLTYGDANEWSFTLYRKRPELGTAAAERLGEARHDEALKATGILGLQPDQLTFLGYPDFGTLRIWESHWGAIVPFRSLLTRVTAVPYPDALRPGAAYKGEDILADLTTVLRDFRPTKVFLSHPADHNPDHLALYLFARVALWNLASEMNPDLYPHLVHYPNWPTPRGQYRSALLEPPSAFGQAIAWQVNPLSGAETDRKGLALQAHQTQLESNRKLLESFVRSNELFGDLPSVQLYSGLGDTAMLSDGTKQPGAPEQLTEAEQAKFVGMEWRSVRLEGNELRVSLDFSRRLAAGTKASVYLFGYRTDRDFAAMPKLNIEMGEGIHAIRDQSRPLAQDSLIVTRQAKQVLIQVPLALLGDPQQVFVSARTYLGTVPLDWVAWRLLEISAPK